MGDVISDNGKRGGSRRSVKAALLGTAAIYLVAGLAGDIVDIAHAQVASQNAAATTSTFNIRPQELGSALTAFADSAGLRLLFPSNLVVGKRSPGISGNLTREQALNRLLAGTGLTWRFTAANTVTIVDPAASNEAGNINADGSLVLDTITVQGQAINNWNAPPEYAGGQVATGARLGVLGNVSIMNAPFSVASYTSKYLKDQQAQNLADAVNDDVSVRHSTARGGTNDAFNFRGFYGSDVTVNGLFGMSPRYRAAVELYDRVEVLKGPSAFLLGTTNNASPGGMINLVTKHAPDDPINSVTVGHSSYGTYGTHVDFSRRYGENKEFGIRANGVFHNGEMNLQGADRLIGAGSLALDYKGGERLRASLDVLANRQELTGAGAFLNVGLADFVPRPVKAGRNMIPNDGHSIISDYTVIGKLEYDFADRWTVFTDIGYRSHIAQFKNAFTGQSDNYGNISPGIIDATWNQRDFSFQSGVRGEFETGFLTHKITASGAFLNRENLNRTWGYTFGGPSNIYNPIFMHLDRFARYGHVPRVSAYDFTSYAISDTISALDERILLTLGGRYQEVSSRSFDGPTQAVLSRYNVNAITPVVGLVVKPWENVSIYGSYIEGLSPGYVVEDSSSPNYGQTFAPQKSHQYEAGVKYDLGTVSTTLALFEIEQPSISADPVTNEYGVNGRTRVRGLEWNVFGEVRPDLRVLGGLSLMKGTQVETAGGLTDGKTAPGVPSFKVNLGIEWDTPWLEGLTLNGRVTYTGSQYVDEANTKKIPNWTRFDIGARYKTKIHGNDLTVRASVENLFNKSYWESTYSGVLVGAAPPRTFRLSATVDF